MNHIKKLLVSSVIVLMIICSILLYAIGLPEIIGNEKLELIIHVLLYCLIVIATVLFFVITRKK